MWDELGVPHKTAKQVFGNHLTILGIDMDVNALTFTLPEEAKVWLEQELKIWSQKGVQHKVKEWQQVAGWLNWALNVYPLLWPALNNVYLKIKGKGQEVWVWANKAIKEDLQWAKQEIMQSDGVLLLKSLSWDVDQATCLLKTDVCPNGIAFWYPALGLAFSASTPKGTLPDQIIFYESLSVLPSLLDAHHRFSVSGKIIIYTDNFTTVAMFNSLQALFEYNCIIKEAVDILLDGDHDLYVLHISGKSNDVADTLSQFEFMRALSLQPDLTIFPFKPFTRVERQQLLRHSFYFYFYFEHLNFT